MRCCKNFLDMISRRKSWDARSLHQTELRRSLNVLELIGIGIGSCAGLGIFVTSAHIAKHEAGPAAVVSVIIAGVVALLSGLCHIELATRLPRSGTGYTFCYVTFGELLAFVIGWNVILENVINGSVAAKAAWQYLEYMYNYTAISNVTDSTEVSQIRVFAPTPDIFPCCVVIAITFMSLTTVKTYAIVNFVLMSASGLVVLAFICVGFLHVDSENWNSQPGFFVHGFGGVMSGAALMMSTFSSIDNLASCAEESRTPYKSLPTAFSFVIPILFTVILLATLALTLATPWQQLSDSAALARAYDSKGIFAANYVIGSGAVLALLPVVIGSFLHPVRLMYSMSVDNLLPRFFSKIAFLGVPVCSHMVTGALTSLCALLFEFPTLLEISSISIILQFVASSIILLFIRYQPVPIGICQEYSEIVCDDAVSSKDVPELQERCQKLVRLANGEHKLQKNDVCLYTSYCIAPSLSTATTIDSVTAKTVKLKSTSYPPGHDGSYPYSWSSSLASFRLFNKLTKKSVVNTYTEKGKLQNGFVDTVNANESDYGYVDRQGSENAQRDNNYANAKDKTKVQTSSVASSGKRCFIHTSISNSFIAFSPMGKRHADEQTWKLTRYFLLMYILASVLLSVICPAWYYQIAEAWLAVTLTVISLALMIVCALFITRQPQNTALLYFKTPYVPGLPLLSLTCNMILLASLPVISWARFAIWLVPGLLVYIFYSRRHSIHRPNDDQEVVLFDISQAPSANSK